MFLNGVIFTLNMINEVVSDNNYSSFLVEKENIRALNKSSNEIEDITAPNSSSEDSVYISTADSAIEILNDIERSVLFLSRLPQINLPQYRFMMFLNFHHLTFQHRNLHRKSSDEKGKEALPFVFRFQRPYRDWNWLQNLKNLKQSVNLSKLPDCERRLLEKIKMLEEKLINRDAFGRDANVAPNGLIYITNFNNNILSFLLSLQVRKH
ncbi:unnamed protein product [Brugia pahangi]|uniref:Uncharacterized protein n=1 Tax=Brugia pahangi TaxID=6280 RepID=A0A0N4TWA6_BRUPA|nr:unnamed protein product [Brugia pahangi]